MNIAIANQITEAYYARCSKSLSINNRGESQMRQRISDGFRTVEKHHLIDNQEKALAVIPVDLIHERTTKRMETHEQTHEEALTRELLMWFKTEFFVWCDTLNCIRCDTKTLSHGTTEATAEERKFGATMAEIHRCPNPQCGHFNRFQRYNDPIKLLETRKGRCGEWANCFGLVLASMGLESRYVIDFTDHVWNEVLICGEWIHCDSCENSFNQPHLYEVGWEKKLNYCLSIGPHQIVDSTRRYTLKYSEVLTRTRRTLLSEIRLFLLIRSINRERKQGLQDNLLKEILDLEAKELTSLLSSATELDYTTLMPRQSGTLEWRAARGEMGGGV